MTDQPFRLSPRVAAALAENRPVVALESTIITHGMPYPQNVETARGVEALVRAEGAEPATIAVLDGVLRIGLDDAEIEALAKATSVMKLSRADLAFAMATGRTGSTTVAATMIAAALAGIGVFATGGIGGVHRGAGASFDISADLDELAATPVIVVSAGAKAILDIGKTLEVLETKGVPVIGYRSDDWPAFWSRVSGLPAPLRLDSAEAIASFQHRRSRIGLGGGMLIGNPVDAEDEIEANIVELWIADALGDADRKGIAGKAVTPFLLQRIFELSEGRSLETNIALVRSNARLAAGIAKALVAQRLAEALSAD
ncbi:MULTISPECIES: pseudouridine-5'-phosphate glycosidase [unclassified Aureimonas]|uniref:pseudouridine-5'-phosphate glycosidase n=1 Tax=unclassified Aureimonas TaxID=2615206 RepID=UPI0006FD11BA|nr:MULTISPECIES: pseudouridine-5'-phosphate glycosidase [unclassified Aureimonas]KQT57419.1 pseudouridine-5-phosphate glycosidase [Aureimonas sp. Leaf427]KQT77098.1 pseudouridine-5-phosphate glycosidase [Aureimonas sp. Leaf460]